MGIASPCGCGSPQQNIVQQVAPAPADARTTQHVHAMTSGGGDATGVRDADAATRNLALMQQSVARFADINEAIAAGYRYNPDGGSEGGLQHWINNAVFATGDASNLALPATLMYQVDSSGAATLVGTMISVDPAKHAVPDYGAGAWHTHPDDPQLNMHVWLGKTVAEGAFENNSGMV